MQKRIDDLSSYHSTMSRKEVRKRLEAWDQDQGRAMAAAEAVLKVNPKQYNWSPRLRNTGIMYRYWRLRLREHLKGVDYSNSFARWESQQQKYDSQFKLPGPSRSFDITKVRVHLTAAKKTLRKMQSDSTALWLKRYYDLLAAYDAEQSKESRRKAKIVNHTIRGVENRQMFSALRKVVKPSDFSALSKIQVPRDAESTCPSSPDEVAKVLDKTAPENMIWDTVIDRPEIEAHLALVI